MTPMCHVDTGYIVGWASGTVTCDASSIVITYTNTSGVPQGTTKPASWEPCRPGWASNTVHVIIQLTQTAYNALPAYDPNTLYLIIG